MSFVWKLVQWRSYFMLDHKWNCALISCIFCHIWMKFTQEMPTSICWVIMSFMRNGTVKVTIYLKDINFYLYFPHWVWVKFDIRDLHMILLNISEFCDSQHREGLTFLMDINWNYIYTCTVEICAILKLKLGLVKSVFCSTEYTIFSFV